MSRTAYIKIYNAIGLASVLPITYTEILNNHLPMADLPDSINLLTPVNAPEDVWEKTYNWLFSVGKYILISVQLVVLSVFIARFSVDRANNELSEDINVQVSALSQEKYRDGEFVFRNLHGLLADVALLEDLQGENTTYISSVIETLPNDLELERFGYTEGNVSLAFSADDFEEINTYESALRRNPNYRNIQVNLTKSGDTTSEIIFTVSFDIISETEEEL